MLVNIENAQGWTNAALQSWSEELGRNEYTPVVGTVIRTDNGGAWQLRDTSWWCDGAWKAEALNTDAVWDGIRVEVTGRTIQRRSDMGWGTRVRITFVGDGEEDQVVGGWMKTG